MIFSSALTTNFQSSFKTRFKIVFSQVLANCSRLQREEYSKKNNVIYHRSKTILTMKVNERYFFGSNAQELLDRKFKSAERIPEHRKRL